MSNDAQEWWDRAIARNRAALLRIVAVLFVRAGLDEGGAETLSRRAVRAILAVLRPAESAVRRLIVIAARGIAVEPPRAAEKPPTAIERLQAAGLLVIHEGINLGLARAPLPPQPVPAPGTSRPALFLLADRRKRFDLAPRPFPQAGVMPADGDELVDAAPLCRRLTALKAALDDLTRHAERLARREARRVAAADGGLKCHARPLRRGHPPGWRRRPVRDVDDILRECHSLALRALKPPDTS
jgi:hypothetical protein